jgi:hypothetical protein
MRVSTAVVGLGYVSASELVGEHTKRGAIVVFERRPFID